MSAVCWRTVDSSIHHYLELTGPGDVPLPGNNAHTFIRANPSQWRK